MSDAIREIAEYIELYAKKHHITTEEALNHVMVSIFKDYRRKSDDSMDSK